LRRRFDNRNALTPQFLQEQGANQSTVIHIKPFGGADERTEVAGPRVAGGSKEKMNMQSGQLAALWPELAASSKNQSFHFARNR